MTPAEVLLEALSRIPETARAAVDGLDEGQLARRPDAEANSIAWLIWHTAREQDAQIAPLARREQAWTADGWYERFDLPFAADEMGYGQSSEQAGQVRAPADLLLGYLDAAQSRTREYVESLGEHDLDQVVDEGADPPVSVGARLVSIIDDGAQHAGQAGYLRGLIDRA